MPVEDALEAMQALAAETGLDLSDEALGSSQAQASEAPAAPEEEPQAEVVAEQAETSQAPAAAPVAQPAPQQQQPDQISAAGVLRELMDERDKRQALEKRIREFEASQKPAEPPKPEVDPFLDPTGFADARAQAAVQAAVAPIMQALSIQVARTNLSEARAVHGAELADKAYQEFDAAMSTMTPAERASVMQAANPFIAAVRWMKNRDVLAEVGEDPTAYRQRIAEQLLQDPEFLGRASEAARSFAAGNTGVQPAAQPQAQPRTQAGQFASPAKPPALPSVNRAGSGAGSAPIKAPPQTDLEVVDEVLGAKGRPAWAS